MKVLLAASEVTPFIKTGGLADVAGILPVELKSLGCETKVFLPHYRQTKKQSFDIAPLKKNLKLKMGGVESSFELHQCNMRDVDFCFIDKDEYYDRDYVYNTPTGDYPDNALRFAFFSKAILEASLALRFKPDIIHCNDWQTALALFYLRHDQRYTEFFKGSKTLFTIHNMAYQGLFPRDAIDKVDIDDSFFTPEELEFYGRVNFLKSGIIYSDAVSTVSKGYAREILTKEYGCGLEGLLASRKDKLHGILNGVDYTVWNPAIDKHIKANYDKTNLENKEICKKDLLEEIGIKTDTSLPLIGVITRLAEQKGIDVIADAAERIISLGCNIVILGIGEERYHKLLSELAKAHPKNISVKLMFDNPLAHRIEAGSDMFIMPSRYEPCGLNQMYSLKYGTIPVVRATGGLDDTIVDYTCDKSKGNGFKFEKASPDELLEAIRRALSVFKNKEEWEKLVKRGMGLDFSWNHSAREYIRLYKSI